MSRKRRLLCVLAGAIISLAVAAAWYLGRALYYQHQLDRTIAQYRQRGERILPEDFPQPRLGNDDNAALLLRAAGRSIELSDVQRAFLSEFDAVLPLDESEVRMVRRIVTQNAHVLANLRDARARQDADWGLTPGAFSGQIDDLPHLTHMRDLTRLVRANALLAFHEGDHHAAVDHCAAIWFIHEMTNRQATIVPRLVAVGISAASLAALEQMAPELSVVNAGRPAHARPARREQVEQMIHLLLDEQQAVAAINCAWDGERAEKLAMARYFATTSVVSRINFNRAAIMSLEACDVARRSCLAPPLSAARDALRAMPQRNSPEASEQWVQILIPSLQRIHVTEFRIRTERRLCATALAVRLYRHDNGGKFPSCLTELVPRYLPALPSDPYDARQAPLKYSSSEPRVYSVGENGVDDEGASGPAGPIDWSAPDYVLFLQH